MKRASKLHMRQRAEDNMRTQDVNREPWDLPVEWWDETPSWLYDLAPYLKAPQVRAFTPVFRTADRGWRFDLWLETDVRARYHIEEGGVQPSGTMGMRTLNDSGWYRIDPLEDPAIGELPDGEPALTALRFDEEPESWKLGQWGWAVPRDEGVVTGTFPMPRSADIWESRKLADAMVHSLGHGHNVTGHESSIAFIAPDGQTTAQDGLFRIIQEDIDTSLVRIPSTHWWEQTAGMPAW
jgi:hypothetical protein